MINKKDIQKGQRVYTTLTLKIYNLVVLMISNRYAWKCLTKTQLSFFNKNITNNHLDIGVGTGYYLDKCQFQKNKPVHLTLLDINKDCLLYCTKKLRRYNPTVIKEDIFNPSLRISDKFDSISLNYVIHCLPGTLQEKEIIFHNIKHLLNENGVLFGATIFGSGIKYNLFAKLLLKLYNKKQVFNNLLDTKEDLFQALGKHFKKIEIEQIGLVGLFRAYDPI